MIPSGSRCLTRAARHQWRCGRGSARAVSANDGRRASHRDRSEAAPRRPQFASAGRTSRQPGPGCWWPDSPGPTGSALLECVWSCRGRQLPRQLRRQIARQLPRQPWTCRGSHGCWRRQAALLARCWCPRLRNGAGHRPPAIPPTGSRVADTRPPAVLAGAPPSRAMICGAVASSHGSPNGSGHGSPNGSGSGLGPATPASGSDPAPSGASSAARGADCGPLEPAVPHDPWAGSEMAHARVRGRRVPT